MKKKETLKQIYLELVEDIINRIYRLLNKDSLDHLYQEMRYFKFIEYLQNRLKQIGEKEKIFIEKQMVDTYEKARGVIGDIPADFIEEKWCGDGKRFSDRIWKDKDKLLEKLNKGLIDCATAGNSVDEYAKEIAQDCKTSYFNAYRLMRTETMRAEIEGTLRKYKDAGVERIQIISAHDDRVCPLCKERDGKILPISASVDEIVTHPMCRCAIKAVL